MKKKLVLNDADDLLASQLIRLFSRDLSEEQMAEEMKLSLSDFNLLIKGFHTMFGTETLHGLLAAMICHRGKVSYYDLSHWSILHKTPEPTD